MSDPAKIHTRKFQDRFIRESVAACKANPPLTLELDWSYAMSLIAQLQLALRHPNNVGASAQVTREFCDRLIAILGVTPTIREGLEAGYASECDGKGGRP